MFRLNEGHTKFVERIIVSRIRAKDGQQAFRDFLCTDGLRALTYAVRIDLVL